MAVKRILDIDIKNKGLFSAIYGNISDGEFFVDNDLRKYNLWQQLFIYLKSMLYDNVIFYDTTNNFHSYSKSDLIRFLNLEIESNNDKPKYQSRHIRSALGNRRFNNNTPVTKPKNEKQINSSIKLISEFGKKHSFYRTNKTLEIENYLKINLTNKKKKTAIIIKNPENSTFDKIERFITLFKTLDNNYTIDGSQNKVIIVHSSNTTTSSFIESYNTNGQLFLNDFFKNLFLKDVGDNKYEIIKKNVSQIKYAEKDEIKNLINLRRIIEKKSEIFNIISLDKLSEFLELEQLSNNVLYTKNLLDLSKQFMDTESGISRLDKLIGLSEVKKTIKSFIKKSKYNKEKNIDRNPRYHLMFTGNPGTGKTIVAEILADIIKENQIIKGGKFTMKKASDFLSKYANETAEKTKNICKNALGGVLFIDEAYALTTHKETGRECMAELIQFMENERDRLVVIFAGYKKDMEALFELNEGLKRRIGKIIHFPNYSSSELIEILKLKMKGLPFSLEYESIPILQNWLEQRIAEDPVGFGNAGGIDKLVDELFDIVIDDDKDIITKEDLTEFLKIENKIDSNIELNKLVGLTKVKDSIKKFIKRAEFNKTQGLEDNSRYHLLFTGNTGTGKTIVAKIVARIYKEKQLIKGGKFTEVKASDLIAGFVGQTAIKTKKVCEKALGGVLFIDEAYALAPTREGQNHYGHEAIAELIQYMENERDRFAVIFAGYKNDIQRLLALNEGLENRIGETIHFPDYSADELIEILKLKIKNLPIKLSDDVLLILRNWIEKRILENSKKFGNGRGVDKLKTALLDIRINTGNEQITTEDIARLDEYI